VAAGVAGGRVRGGVASLAQRASRARAGAVVVRGEGR
jgi:hypothetical protein